jgi:DNA repair protein RadC
MGAGEYRIPPGALRIRDLPPSLKPREEVDRVGVDNVSDDVLLAILLRSGAPGLNVAVLARHLLARHGSLTAIAAVSTAELMQERGIGKVKAQVLKCALELARRMAREETRPGAVVRTPEDVARLLRAQAQPLTCEVFWVLLLNAKNHLIALHEVSRGILDASLVHPREVFKRAVETRSAAVILAHNHPSGDPAPSAEDVRITRQLVDAGRVMGIRVMDHVVLGLRQNGRENDFVSLRETGMLAF